MKGMDLPSLDSRHWHSADCPVGQGRVQPGTPIGSLRDEYKLAVLSCESDLHDTARFWMGIK